MIELSVDEQVSLWAQGESIHLGPPLDPNQHIDADYYDDVPEDEVVGICCPDFSCCRPKLAWPQSLREKFLNGDDPTRNSMLSMGITSFLTHEGQDVLKLLREDEDGFKIPFH